jgi:hypothetical protein
MPQFVPQKELVGIHKGERLPQRIGHPRIVAVPLDVDERIEIGWIGHSAIPLTERSRVPRRSARRCR